MGRAVGSGPIEHANIVDDESTILRDHFYCNSPPASARSSYESIPKVNGLPEKVYVDQKRPILL